MATLVIDMPSGIAGDMLLAALLDAGGNLATLHQGLLDLGLGPIPISATRVQAGPLQAMRVDVCVDQSASWDGGAAAHAHSHAHSHDHGSVHHHGHSHGPGEAHDHDHSPSDRHAHPSGLAPASPAGLPSFDLRLATDPHPPASVISAAPVHPEHRPYKTIRDLLDRAPLPERVRARAQKIFRLLAEAEGAVHGMPADEVEFHEVGALDAIADVVGCCLLLEQLGIDRVLAGPINPGHGSVRCAHGLMPVPVPAVATMLARTRAPMVSLGWQTGELTTPTGCALVCGLAERFLDQAVRERWTVLASGTGAGHKTIPGLVNAVRCLVVELQPTTAVSADAAAGPAREDAGWFLVPGTEADTVVELRCQLDDATGEQLAHALAALLAAGARDAWLAPVLMKKGRPGYLLTVLAAPADAERIAGLILATTPTIGLRAERLPRALLARSTTTVVVAGHQVALKIVTLPDGGQRAKPEADAVARVAAALGWDAGRVHAAALAAWSARA